MEHWKFFYIVHYLFLLHFGNYQFEIFPFKVSISSFRRCLNPFSASCRKWPQPLCYNSYPLVCCMSRGKLSSISWHQFVPCFHSPTVTVSAAQPPSLPPRFLFCLIFWAFLFIIFRLSLVGFTYPFLQDSPGAGCPVWDLFALLLKFQKLRCAWADQSIFLCLPR